MQRAFFLPAGVKTGKVPGVRERYKKKQETAFTPGWRRHHSRISAVFRRNSGGLQGMRRNRACRRRPFRCRRRRLGSFPSGPDKRIAASRGCSRSSRVGRSLPTCRCGSGWRQGYTRKWRAGIVPGPENACQCRSKAPPAAHRRQSCEGGPAGLHPAALRRSNTRSSVAIHKESCLQPSIWFSTKPSPSSRNRVSRAAASSYRSW